MGRFDDRVIAALTVDEDQNLSGDRFINVSIVLDEDVSDFDVVKATDSKRDFRAELDEAFGYVFPILRFISKYDAPESA